MAGVVVIGYDGSQDAQRAVDVAAGALRVDAALVVNVWSSAVATTQPAAPLAVPLPPSEAELQGLAEAAQRVADEGAARARQAGLAAGAQAGAVLALRKRLERRLVRVRDAGGNASGVRPVAAHRRHEATGDVHVLERRPAVGAGAYDRDRAVGRDRVQQRTQVHQ